MNFYTECAICILSRIFIIKKWCAISNCWWIFFIWNGLQHNQNTVCPILTQGKTKLIKGWVCMYVSTRAIVIFKGTTLWVTWLRGYIFLTCYKALCLFILAGLIYPMGYYPNKGVSHFFPLFHCDWIYMLDRGQPTTTGLNINRALW